MKDSEEILESFKEKFNTITHQQREEYLKQHGFKFSSVAGNNITKPEVLKEIESNIAMFNSLPREQRKELLSHCITLEENINPKMEFIMNMTLLSNDILGKYDKLSEEYKQKISVIILDKLGYRQIENESDIYKNMNVIGCVIPTLNLNRIINIYYDDKNKQKEILEYIDQTVDCLLKEMSEKRLCMIKK